LVSSVFFCASASLARFAAASSLLTAAPSFGAALPLEAGASTAAGCVVTLGILLPSIGSFLILDGGGISL
jgi:hypothetical protein